MSSQSSFPAHCPGNSFSSAHSLSWMYGVESTYYCNKSVRKFPGNSISRFRKVLITLEEGGHSIFITVIERGRSSDIYETDISIGFG